MPEDRLDHDVRYAELVQICSQSPPERVPPAPADLLAFQCWSNCRSNDVLEIDRAAEQAFKEISVGLHRQQVKFKYLLQPWYDRDSSLATFPFGFSTLFRQMLR